MKREFSIERALGDGLRLSFRRPWTVFLWGLLSVAPIFIVIGGFVPLMLSGGELAADPAEAFGGAHALAFNLAIHAANGIQLVVSVFVAAAVIRATAAAHGRRESSPPFFGLGVEELLTAASMLAVGIGICAVIFPLVLVGVGLGFGFYSLGGLWAWAPVTLYGIVAVAGVIYLGLRLSLLIPASALTGTLALPAAWKATQGQTLRLLGLGLLSWLIQLVISAVAMLAIVLMVVGAALASGWRWETFESVETLTDLAMPWPLIGVAVVAALIFAWLQGVTQAMTLAPFTSAWLQLTRPESSETADETPPDALASTEL